MTTFISMFDDITKKHMEKYMNIADLDLSYLSKTELILKISDSVRMTMSGNFEFTRERREILVNYKYEVFIYVLIFSAMYFNNKLKYADKNSRIQFNLFNVHVIEDLFCITFRKSTGYKYDTVSFEDYIYSLKIMSSDSRPEEKHDDNLLSFSDDFKSNEDYDIPSTPKIKIPPMQSSRPKKISYRDRANCKRYDSSYRDMSLRISI